ncbi:hypothetical protein ALMP_82030 [Streptomyces sp. A012304]|nr:hypothetical protein ALMP_82030 [Streptomyces sp. A012304]
MTTISRLRHSTISAHQRRVYGPVIFSTGVFAKSGIEKAPRGRSGGFGTGGNGAGCGRHRGHLFAHRCAG